MRSALACSVLLWLAPCLALAAEDRIFEFTYEVLEQNFPSELPVDIFVPLPADGVGQQILVQTLQSSVPGTIGRDSVHGNYYYHLHRAAGDDTPLSASLSWTVVRQPVGAYGRGELSEATRQQALAPDALVPVDHAILQPILEEIHKERADDSAAATARAIYDWVVDNVEYKKVGTGWGNGDTFWACNARYGNCTDFHALFISLARTEGIPARFEIGFPIPTDRQEGEISGYHCWVHFYLPDQGWLPIDASEAAKHPELRESLYGGNPADRIHFSSGRDLVMSPGSSKHPLNYFIYPYVELGGTPWTEKLATRFSFRELATADADS